MSEFEFDREGFNTDNFAIEKEKEQAEKEQNIPEKEPSVFEEAASTVEKEERPAGEYTYAFRGDSLPSGGTYDPRKTAEEKAPSRGVYGNPETYIPYSAERQQTPYGGAHRPEQNPYGYGQSAYGENPYAAHNAYGAPSNGYRPVSEPTPPAKEPKAKKKSSVKTSTAILLCVACVLLSFASGILGSALIYGAGGGALGDYELSEGDTENGAVAGIDKNGAVVLYRSVETVKEDGSAMTVAEVANTVSDSVVEITTEFVTTDNFFFGQFVNEGAGSGVIISQDGYIITNNHVISDTNSGDTASKITVRLRSGEEYEASLVGKDSDSDVAILKIKAENLKAAVWGDSEKLVVGQQVVAVGNPLGELGGTVTQGIISASDREVQIDNVVMTLIQIDAAVNPGNSGGGLFNTKGELIGIVNAKSSGSGIEGLGFAIPSNEAQDITTQLLEHGYVRGKVYLGLSFYEANSGYFSSSGEDGILYVYAAEEGYNDDVLQSKDIILSIDGEEVSTTAEVKAILKKHKVGDKLTFSILRDRVPMEVEVTCYEAKPIGSSVDFDD